MSDLKNVLLVVFISLYSTTILAKWRDLPGIISETDTIEITDCPWVLDVAVGLRVRGIAGTITALIEPPSEDIMVDLISDMPVCENSHDLMAVIDDDALWPPFSACIPFGDLPVTGVFKPDSRLSILNNKSGNGTWRVRVDSNETSPLLGWSLDMVCSEPPQEIISCDSFESCPTQ
jgi:hypothetical protein